MNSVRDEADITNFHLVVYDESDEGVTLSAEARSAAWKARIAETPLQYGVGKLTSFGDHFYLVLISI